MDRKKEIRIGTRGSLLALEQTNQVIAALTATYSELHIEKVILHTQGDKILNKPLLEFGGKGVFITEFEEALKDGRIDLAVHSAKDMPMELADGLVIAGALPRADVRDVLVTRKGLSENVVIGTGSLRRQFQLKAIYPDVQCISIRGNVPTRLQKVRDGECDGVILAAAGLERLGLLAEPDFDYRYFSQEEMVPAGGQGIIAIESRMEDEIVELVSRISNQNAMLELETERRILQLLEAGCHEAIGVISQVKNKQIAIQIIQELKGKVYRRHGETTVKKRLELAEQLVNGLQNMGKVYLIGAGPGDAGLITVKGLEILKRCDAVVYDRLATEELLDVVPVHCEKIYVGKEAGKHYKKQAEINDILVECAKTHNIVARLKGGDSFVFGRGGEEIEALLQYDIPYEVIPGVTSAVAVPECAGIPVTHRGVARSFHVITGHTQNSVGSPDYDYETLGKMEGTLVFLMGLSNLGEITDNLIQAGKAAHTPAAVISDGTTAYQKVVRGTLGTIEEKVKESNLQSPAIIVIGETAEYEYRYSSVNYKKVGITATDLLWEKLETGLEGLGMHPILLCKMKVVQTEQMQALDAELNRLERYQWILFTSQNAIRLFFQEMKRQQIDVRILGSIKFAVLGSGTAAKLLEYGIKADFIPSAYTVSTLGEEFVKIVKEKEKVLIPRAVQGSKELTDILKREQVEYLDLAIYDVVGNMTKNIQCLENLDYLVFVSASGVTAFFEELQRRKLSLPEHIRIACIGKITEKRLLEKYGKADVVATVNDVEGLLDKIKIAEEKNGSEC